MSVHLDSPEQLLEAHRSTGIRSRSLRTLRRDPGALVGAIVITFLIVVALAAPVLAPYPDQGRGEANVPARDEAPSVEHLFGTDHLGRDVLSRVMFGGRPAIGVAIAVVILSILIGVPLGMIAGYRGGWMDEALMRFTDLFLAFPPLLLAMVIAATLGASLFHAALALAISWWPWYARLARAVTQSIKHEPYIDAARVFGVREPVILARHVLRNATTPILVQATIDAGTVILAVGALAFLGLAAQPPTADWGLMVAEGRTTVVTEWWISTFPGLAIFAAVLAFTLLGDALRDVLDPEDGVTLSALLEIDNLKVDFARDGRITSRALRGVSLSVETGEALGVVGETGCGKTLTGLSVLRMLPENATASGRVVFEGRDMLTLSTRELRKIRGRQISMVFQSPGTSFNPVFTVGYQIALVAKLHLGLGGNEAERLVAETLHTVGLPNPESVMRFYPHELSGGMLQRAMIAMAIICGPSLLIADEPTTALDVTIAQQILRLLRRLQRDQGFGVFFISHDLDLVSDFCDRIAVLYAGRVVETGTTAQLLSHPRHPYTRALLEALPGRAEPGASLPTVPGVVPGDVDEAPGCAFAPRCPLVDEECLRERPALTTVAPGHEAACFRWDAP